jgi:hypothetical protein
MNVSWREIEALPPNIADHGMRAAAGPGLLRISQ